MPASLTAHQEPISRIFSDDYVFNIPGYQRPYAWGSEQARDLFEDLVGFFEGRSHEIENVPPYFLGSIVLIKAESEPTADVVDGQQRLTTLTILLAAIRANVSQKSAEDITKLIYEEGSQILGTRDRFRLSLRERDREFFQRYIQRNEGFEKLLVLQDALSDSQRNIRDNAAFFDKAVKAMVEAERLKLAQFLVTRCYLVVVATPDLESAYRIFSVLNTRGLDLAATDILKAQIIGRIPGGMREAYTEKWEDTEEDIGRAGFDDLFGHIRMIYRKAKPQGTLLTEFREYVIQHLAPQQFIDDVLIPMSAVYEELTDAAYSSKAGAEVVNESLKWLNRLEFNDWLPPALAFAVRYRATGEKMQEFFCHLERLGYALLLMRSGVNERIERFARLTKFIEADDDLAGASSPLQLTRTEKFKIYQVLVGPLYETLSARARSTVLLRLDRLLSSGGATYDYETVSVEHVLPQNPSEGSLWLKWFPDPLERAEWVHRLGNLVLLTRKKIVQLLITTLCRKSRPTSLELGFLRSDLQPR